MKRRPSPPGAEPAGDLPLPDPYPEYVPCPECGEPEVETWSDLPGARCPVCGVWVPRPGGEGAAEAA